MICDDCTKKASCENKMKKEKHEREMLKEHGIQIDCSRKGEAPQNVGGNT